MAAKRPSADSAKWLLHTAKPAAAEVQSGQCQCAPALLTCSSCCTSCTATALSASVARSRAKRLPTGSNTACPAAAGVRPGGLLPFSVFESPLAFFPALPALPPLRLASGSGSAGSCLQRCQYPDCAGHHGLKQYFQGQTKQ